MVKGSLFVLFLTLGVFGMHSFKAQAEPIRQPEIIPYKCAATPALKVNFPPNDEIGKTNNLWRKTGLAMPAFGRPIYIKGVVLDRECKPVQGAVVQIWQADNEGDYALGDKGKKKIDPYFGESGTTYTNNLGEYSFITIFPGAEKGEVPYIRFRVKQRDFKPLRTKMYFAETASKDKDYNELSAKKSALLTAVSDPNGLSNKKEPMTYYFNLSLKEKLMYKEY
jgi:protocatechuate 3,4-dioxygenase beta subunit